MHTIFSSKVKKSQYLMMPVLISFILAATLILPCAFAQQQSYWIDQSCIAKNAQFESVMQESITVMAGGASTKDPTVNPMKFIALWIWNMSKYTDADQIKYNYKVKS